MNSFFKYNGISNRAWDRFIDFGQVDNKILVRITQKIMESKELNEREMAIFTSKTSLINEMIRDINFEKKCK